MAWLGEERAQLLEICSSRLELFSLGGMAYGPLLVPGLGGMAWDRRCQPAGDTEEPPWAQCGGWGGVSTVKICGDISQVCLSLALTWP